MERTILRFAVYELLYHREAPPKVIINEAIELAKQFGDETRDVLSMGSLGNCYGKQLKGTMRNE